ncbi:TIGR03560 family F420-dependent LLM class oxidoreductase [Streptosporangium lutulentum]
MRFGSGDPGTGPTDAWMTLAGLARETSRIRLGTLVSAATFRLPGPLAISVAQVDQMSGGRVELGLGTGWFDTEHNAYGIPFPPLGERFGRFEEQLEIITGLWTTPVGERFSFEGAHYRLADSPALPKPAQSPKPPIIIGGSGPSRTPRLAARFADEYNLPFHGLEDTAVGFDRVRRACEEEGVSRSCSPPPRPSASAATTRNSRVARRPSGRGSTGCARAGWRGPPPRWSRRSASSRSWAPSESTCR